MEKISHVIPASSRVKSVDMSKERPVRSSAPGFGAPESKSVPRGPQKLAVKEGPRVYNETYGPDAKMAREAEMVKKMTDQFFANQARSPEMESVSSEIEGGEVETEIAVAPEKEAIEFAPTEPKINNEDAEPGNPANFSKRI